MAACGCRLHLDHSGRRSGRRDRTAIYRMDVRQLVRIAQNLSTPQILDQVLQAGQILTSEQRRLHNIVFMGMGEPFHNEQNLYEVLEILTDVRQFERSPGSLLVSTVGIPEAMVRCARRFPRVNLALSWSEKKTASGRRFTVRDEIPELTAFYGRNPFPMLKRL